MNKVSLCLAIGIISLLAVGFSAEAVENEDPWATSLTTASKGVGVEINTGEMFNLARSDRRIVVAPLVGFEQVAATEALVGMDIGFGYFDVPDSRIPTGFFTLRLHAKEINLGPGQGVVEFIDQFGQVAARVPADLQVNSLTVPDPLPYPNTIVAGGSEFNDSTRLVGDRVWIICPNGLVVCFDDDFDQELDE